MARPMPRGDQLTRQWRLLQMIDRPLGVTVDDAAHDLKCTIRTIWRDLDALQKAGFRLFTARAAAGNRHGHRTANSSRGRRRRVLSALTCRTGCILRKASVPPLDTL